MNSQQFFLLVTFLLTMSFAPLFAQESAEDPGDTRDEEKDLPEVEVTEFETDGYLSDQSSTATKTDTLIMETPKNVQVINREVIDDQKADSLLEVMRNVGSTTEANTFGNTASRVRLRGFEIRDEEVFVDGFPGIADRKINSLTERVEVLRGSSSLLRGNIPAGGLINVITKKPEAKPRYHGEFTSSSNGTFKGFVDLTGPLYGEPNGSSGQLLYRLIAEEEDSEYWRNFGEIDRTVVSPMLTWRNDQARITFSYQHLDREAPFDRGTVIFNGEPANVPVERRFGERSDEITEEVDIFNLNGEIHLSDTWKVRGNVRYQDKESDDFHHRPRSIDSSGNLVRRPDGTEGRFVEQWNIGLNVLGEFKTGILDHKLLGGFEYENEESGRDNFISKPGFEAIGDDPGEPTFNIFDPVFGQTDISDVQPQGFGIDRDQDSSGYYLQDQIKIGEQWTVVGGFRYEMYDRFRTFAGTVDEDSDNEQFLPRGGLVYRPRNGISLWGSYSESFEPNPSAPDVTAADVNGPFDPEEGVNIEAGVKVEPLDGLRTELTLFNITKENITQSVNGLTQATGEVESEGVELNATGEITDEVSVIGTLSFMDVEITDNPGDPSVEGNQLRNATDETGSLFVRYSPNVESLKGLSLGGGVNYVGERPVSNQHDVFLDDYTLTDVFVKYEAKVNGHPVKLQLNVKNLFDEEYFPSSGGDLRINVGEDRVFLFNASIAF